MSGANTKRTEILILALAFVLCSFSAFAQFGPEVEPGTDMSDEAMIKRCIEGSAVDGCYLTYDQCRRWIMEHTLELQKEAETWCPKTKQ